MPFTFDVKVTPNSTKKGWVMDKSGNLKCYLKNPPEQGKANSELIKSLSKIVGISPSMISIVSGAQSRKKKIRLDIDITYNKLLELLGIDWPIDMFG